VKTITNKQLLKSKSCGDSNRYTSCRGKLDQQATCIPRSVRIWFPTICISHCQHIATFRVVINRFEQIHCSREEGLPTQSTAQWLTGPWVRIQLLSHNSHWSSGKKISFCWQPATRLTGPISLVRDQYVQYLLTGANLSVHNGHRRGLQHWRCFLSTSHSPTFPIDSSSLST
jgi:hypothetical protein